VKGVGMYTNRCEPDLIILDLNMPRKDGRQVLMELKSNEEFRKIPVVILTTSSDEEDVTRCYQSFASCYITKPNDFEDFVRVTQAIRDFYFSIVTLPTLTNSSNS
jgi:chemotaxis family two-component system response regulator Rcp1